MMKTKYSIIYTLLLFSLFSCEDQLDQAPISELGSNNFYRNEKDFEQAVNGIYAAMQSYPERQFYLSEVRSDNLYGTTSIGVREHEPLNNFATTIETNTIVRAAWQDNFNGVMRANTVLDKLNPTVIPSQELREQFEGEAKFLRAFYYLNLVRWFGQLPIFTTFITPAEALDIPRSPVDEVYNVIISDLTDAIELLPPSSSASDQGRATSWAAKALLAKAYLTMSGPSYGITGPGLDANKYGEALTLLNDVINNGPFGWVEQYDEIFAYDNENNPDIVFDVQYMSGGLGAGALYPGLMIPEAYGRAVGLPFAPGGIEVIEVTQSLMASWQVEDIREEITVQKGYTDTEGNEDVRPFYNKFLDLGMAGVDRFDWPVNFPVIRFTDVLLMKAEAILQGAGGSQQDVDDIVNMIRERAGLTSVSSVDLEMLVEERRREFAAEGLRWHDLVRTGLVLEVMNAWLPTEDAFDRMPEKMAPEWIIYPIPYDQLIVKEGLYTQNDGY
jgi:hypothetical protein